MVSAADIREVFQYNRAVMDAFLRSLQRLSWVAVTTNRESGHLSLKNTFIHILQVHDGWLNFVVPGRTDDPAEERIYDPDSLTSWPEIRAYYNRVWAGIDERLRALTDRQLSKKVKAEWMPGEYTVRDAFLQTTFEQAHHIGEIIAMYWQMNAEPPEMTWIPHLVRRKRSPR